MGCPGFMARSMHCQKGEKNFEFQFDFEMQIFNIELLRSILIKEKFYQIL